MTDPKDPNMPEENEPIADDVQALQQRIEALESELSHAHEKLKKRATRYAEAVERLRMFEKAFETMQLGVTITDVHGNIIYTNPAEAKMHGYLVSELLGKDVRIFAPRETWRPMSVSEMRKASSFKRERFNLRKDGSVFPVQLLSDAVTDPVGEPRGMITTCEDITERKEFEKALEIRDAILEAVSFAAERFLTVRSWEKDVIDEVLERLGKATEVSHVYFFENSSENEDTLLGTPHNVWLDSRIRNQINQDEIRKSLQQVARIDHWYQKLSDGDLIKGHVSSFSEHARTILNPFGVKSLVIVPIFVNDTWWGFIGFNECHAEREWSTAEIDAFKVAGSLLGALLQNKVAENERLQTVKFAGVLEMAKTACHELNQPLQAISGLAEYLIEDVDPDDELHGGLKDMIDEVEKLGQITGKLNKITKYVTREYIGDTIIIDIEGASEADDTSVEVPQ